MKRKFKCTVTRTDEYEIEFDENVCNEKWMEDFRKVFFPFYSLEEHAEQLAQMRARFGEDFIEGYGYVLKNGKLPLSCQLSERNQPNMAININIISEDDDIDVEVEEME